MAFGIYDVDGKVRLTQSPGVGFVGRYAPDGSIYFTTAPDNGFCGSTAPDGSMYIVDATGSTTIGVYAPNGAIRVTTDNEYNGAWRVSDVSSVVASWDASTSTLALLAAITTHTRASLATMFDSTGKLTYAPNNLLTQSNTFNNAAWTKTNISVTGGVTDPLGGSNASTITATGASANIASTAPISVNMPIGITSIWMKRRTGSGTIRFYGFDNVAQIVTSQVTSSWALVYTAPTTGNGVGFFFEIDILTSGDALDIYAGVAAAVTYETSPRTADQVITTSSAYYGPRIDYDPNTLAVRGLLIEEARTNLLPQSGNFSSVWTFAAGARSTDGTLAPDGVTAAAKFTLTAHNAPHEFYNTANVSITGGATYTGSIFVKKGNYRYVFITVENTFSAGAVAVFDLDNPTAATQTWAVGTWSYSSSSITNVGGGWYRLTITGVPSSSVAAYLIAGFAGAATGNSTANADPTFTAAGTEYGYFFGAQLEAGSFATSYIPTAAASVTRAADVVQFTGAALTALQGSAGSAIVESASIASASPASITNIIRGTNSILYRDTTGKTGTTNGTTALLTAAAPTWNAALRNGLAWSTAGRSITYTSGAVATDANAASNGGTLYLGSSNGSAVEDGWYKSFAIYNQRLPDATLQAKLVVGANY